jgi:uncharacterized protein YkwD
VSRPRNTLIVIALVAVWALVGTASASATNCPNADTQANGLTQDQMEGALGCLINEQRASFGLQPVTPNGQLRDAALSHSKEMVSESYFEHTSPAGLTFINRIEQFGYMNGVRSWVVGENLAWGDQELGTPDALVTAWMNSPPHRENLLRGLYNQIGIAAVPGTPENANDPSGVTVSTEYGFRSFSAKKKGHASKAKARKAKSRKLRRRG